MAQNKRPFQKFHAAAMIARDISDQEVCRQIGITTNTLDAWKKDHGFLDQVAMVRRSALEGTKHFAVADKARRIAMAEAEINRLMALIEARAAYGRKMTDDNYIPGEETGAVAVKDITETYGQGDKQMTRRIREGKFDAQLQAELRKWLEFVAKERGEVDEKVTIAGQAGEPFDFSKFSTEEIERLAEVAIRARRE